MIDCEEEIRQKAKAVLNVYDKNRDGKVRKNMLYTYGLTTILTCSGVQKGDGVRVRFSIEQGGD